jgi:hypothetical protein
MSMAPLPPNDQGGGAKPAATPYRRMIRHLNAIVLDGLKHGYFDCSISSELTNSGKRRVVIKSGKHYQFTIGEDDLP